MRYVVIFLDRDWTITYDQDYYLGSQDNWPWYVQFLPWVIEWLQKISHWNRNHNIYIFTIIVTNQSWCAFCPSEEKYIALSRVESVNRYIELEIAKYGGKIDLTIYSPYISEISAEKYRKRGICINPVFIHDSSLTKPYTGMMEKAMELLSLSQAECIFFMIGDRISDMEFGRNIRAKKSYLVSSINTKYTKKGQEGIVFHEVENPIKISPSYPNPSICREKIDSKS